MTNHPRASAMAIGLLLVLPVAAIAETRYVSLTGSDWVNPCLQASPCRTIGAAVAAAGGGDTIVIEPGLFVEAAPIVIDKPLTIEGAGAGQTSVKPNTAVQVFDVYNVDKPHYKVTIRSLEIHGGKEGITNSRTLTLEDVDVRDNLDAGIINGNYASIELRRVRAFGNQGPGFNNRPEGVALVTGSGFFDNAGNPGGVQNGGILFMHTSHVANNVGLQIAGIGNLGSMYLTNVTISGNVASETAGHSGGIALVKGVAILTHVTIVNNSAALSGGISTAGGGKVTLRNTIVAGNTSPQCRIAYNGIQIDGDITGAGNLTSDSSCNLWPASGADGGSGNLIGIDAGLLSLSDNGGGTLTHALLPGSAAIDAGYLQFCLKADQRGVVRPVDGDQDGTARCDIGAYEYNFEVGGGSRDGRAYWHYRGHWFRNGPSNHRIRREPIRRE